MQVFLLYKHCIIFTVWWALITMLFWADWPSCRRSYSSTAMSSAPLCLDHISSVSWFCRLQTYQWGDNACVSLTSVTMVPVVVPWQPFASIQHLGEEEGCLDKKQAISMPHRHCHLPTPSPPVLGLVPPHSVMCGTRPTLYEGCTFDQLRICCAFCFLYQPQGDWPD